MPSDSSKPAPQAAAQQQQQAKGKNPDRFYCPYPGCNRSFAELWRLKVHYRAPPDVRGSGKERGHGTELELCPKCGKDLKPGKHHVGCSAGRSAPRQAAKRVKTEGGSDAHGVHTGGGIAVGQPVLGFPVNRPEFFAPFPGAANPGPVYGVGPGRPEDARQQPVPGIAAGVQPLPMVIPRTAANGLPQPSLPGAGCRFNDAGGTDVLLVGAPSAGFPTTTEMFAGHPRPDAHIVGWGQPAAPPIAVGAAADQGCPVGPAAAYGTSTSAVPGMPVSTEVVNGVKHGSDKPGIAAAAAGAGAAPDAGRPPSPPPLVPSPPPMPADWDMSSRGTGVLFDFDLFNTNRQQEQHHHEQVRPFVTVTTAMNPADMACPSDDYIMQILFGDVNEPVPRRMTAHLHQFDDDDAAGSPFANGSDQAATTSANPALGAGGGALSASLEGINALLADHPHPAPAPGVPVGQHGGDGGAGPQQQHHQQQQQQHGGASKQTALAASVAAGLPVEQAPASVPMTMNPDQPLTVPH